MRRAITETRRRRSLQQAYNEEHGIEPRTISKAINDIMDSLVEESEATSAEEINKELAQLSRDEVMRIMMSIEDEMQAASESMDFEEAARLRDRLVSIRSEYEGETEHEALRKLKDKSRKGSKMGNTRKSSYKR